MGLLTGVYVTSLLNKEKENRGQCLKEEKREKRWETSKEEKPLIAWREGGEWEDRGKQWRWCHLTASNGPLPLETRPNLRVLASMALEHALHDDRFDFAYSAIIQSSGAIWSGGGFLFPDGDAAAETDRRSGGRLGRPTLTAKKKLGNRSMEWFHCSYYAKGAEFEWEIGRKH